MVESGDDVQNKQIEPENFEMGRVNIVFGHDGRERQQHVKQTNKAGKLGFPYTVGTLITHTPRWTTQGMGYGGLWVQGGRL
jgi:hypothetical protein